MKKIIYLLSLLSSTTFAQQKCDWLGAGKAVDPYHYTITKQGNFSKAAIASAHPLASLIGAQIMQQGGNAFDAAIAVQFALAVVYPNAGNIGGGGFLVAYTTDKKLLALDYREKAPSKSHRDMFLDDAGNAQTQWSQFGHLASGVPGTVAGIFETLKFAKLNLSQLIQPAIDLAAYGFCITDAEAESLNSIQAALKKYNTIPPVFLTEKKWKGGDTLIQQDLAATLKRIQSEGRDGFYKGETAKLIVAEMQRGNGIITLEDLANYEATWRTPLQFNYKKHTIVSMPPPSSGGLIIWQTLKMIEPYPIQQYGHNQTKTVQLMVEAERRAYADRAEHMGDPDYYNVPIKGITSAKYIKQRMQDFDPSQAGKSTAIKAGIPISESEETTHISIKDAYGNIVSITTTLNGSYGSKTVVGGAGFFLNNEMDDFSIKPGVANMYGAIGGEANAIFPGKRMLSSMTPTLILKNKKPFVVVGTPGGTTIPTSVFQSIVNIIDFGMNAYDAVNLPKFHHQWLPDEVVVEIDFPEATKQGLRALGYQIRERSAIGRTELIKLNKKGKIDVAADKRGDDAVAGF